MTILIDKLTQAGMIDSSILAENPSVESILMNGLCDQEDVFKVVKNALALPVVESFDNIDPSVIEKVPVEFISKHHVLPFYADPSGLCLACIDPTEDSIRNELSFYVDEPIVLYGVKAGVLLEALNRFYALNLNTNVKFSREAKADMPKPTAPAISKPAGIPKPEIKKPGSLPPVPDKEAVLPPKPVSLKPVNPTLPPKPGLSKNASDEKTNVEDIVDAKIKEREEKSKVINELASLKEKLAEIKEAKPGDSINIRDEIKEEINKEINKEDIAVKKALDDQKDQLEKAFNEKLATMQNKFDQFEEEKKFNKMQKELEEKMEFKQTLDKLSELEKFKEMVMNNPGMVQNQTDQVVTDIQEDIVNHKDENTIVEEEPVEISSEEIQVIENGKTRQMIVSSCVNVLKKINKNSILTFVRKDSFDFVELVGFNNLSDFKIDNKEASIFKTVYDSGNSYYGALMLDSSLKEFYKKTQADLPQSIIVEPAKIKGKVFAMLYIENFSDIELVESISNAFSNAFSNIL